ncbi:MAG: hypothetical protein Q7K34_00475 [archaeon]|nr:hypothetical protein [archaeon]
MKSFLALFLVLGLFFAGCATQQPGTQEPPQAKEKGTLSLSISSQESYNENSGVSQIMVGFENIKAIGADGHELGLTVNKKIYDVLSLEGEKGGLGSTELESEAFTGLKATVSKIEVLLADGETIQVELPQKEFLVENNFGITKDSETNMVLYFDLYSIAMQDGKYVFAPNMVKLFGEKQFGEFMEKMREEGREVEDELAKPRIEQVIFEPAGVSDENFFLAWTVASSEDKLVEHTAVHWDLVGGHGENFEEYANASDVLTGRTTDGQFGVGFALPEVLEETTLFFRVHAMVEGKHAYSEEKSITIMPATGDAQQEPETKEFTILANDSKFDPNEITVSPGDLVRITFNVPTSGVSWGGEDIRSDHFNTGVVKPGENKTIEFTAPESSFKVRSFWPNSSILKATMNVTIG